MGGGREAPELAKKKKKKLVQRAADKSFRARSTAGRRSGPGSRPRLGCSRPPSCARDGAGRRAPPPPHHRHRDAGSAPHRGRPRKHVHRRRKAREQCADTAPAPASAGPRDGGRRDPPAASPQRARAQGCPRPPPGRRRLPGRIKVRQAGRGRCSHCAAPSGRPRAGTPSGYPPGYLAAAGGRRHLRAARPGRDSKVCRRKVSPPTWGGEDVGGARAEDGEQRWEDVSGPPRCVHHPSPHGAG